MEPSAASSKPSKPSETQSTIPTTASSSQTCILRHHPSGAIPKVKSNGKTTRDAQPSRASKPKPLSTPRKEHNLGEQSTRKGAPTNTTTDYTGAFGRRKSTGPLHRQTPRRQTQTKPNRRPGNTYSETRSQLPSLLTPRRTPKKFCNYCWRSGHTDDTCYWQSWCDHCHREGHNIDNCRSFLAQERHENLCNKLSEQTAVTFRLVETLSHHLKQQNSDHPVNQRHSSHSPLPPYQSWNYAGHPYYPRETEDYLR